MQMSENLHYSTTGLALTNEELRGLEASGWEFAGWYNIHGQPIVRNKKTGEELAYCRMGYRISDICNTYVCHPQGVRR